MATTKMVAAEGILTTALYLKKPLMTAEVEPRAKTAVHLGF
jgi:hypothetical protein